jgi:cytoskeletal protein RodZ
VRESRGLSIDEAARDTRIRREFLDALEHDEFGRLLGDVHVRGCLRTYASYLRLSPDKVVAAYDDALPEGAEPPALVLPAQPEPVLGARRRRDDHRLLVMVAVMVLVLAGAFGVLSARQPAPAPAELPSPPGAAPVVAGRGITVALQARQPVRITIVADGSEPESFDLEVGEGRSFHADSTITVRLSEGGTARLTVSGRDEGFPGTSGHAWQRTYEYGSASSSPSG